MIPGEVQESCVHLNRNLDLQPAILEKTTHTNFSDSELLNMLTSGGRLRMQAINHIYSNKEIRQTIYRHVKKMGGDDHEAQDVFHEGIIALDRNIRKNKFNRNTSIDGYLFGICRNIWNNKWRKKTKMSSNEITEIQLIDDQTPDTLLYTEEQKNYLNKVLELIDKPCRQLLTLWKSSYTMQEIAVELNLSSPALAKKYRYRCMKKLMSQLDQHPQLLESLRYV